MSVAEWQENITSNPYYQPIFEFAKQHPTITILSGIETFKNYGAVKETPTAHTSSSGMYYDAFNAAIAIKAGEPIQLYNKSKLVPGVESLPSFLRFMSPVFEQFGGSTGGYGKSTNSAVFKMTGTGIVSAPIICYESIYGEYVNSYVQQGANLLTIITNDGWWGNTPGHKQHLSYARLRAIETRRWVARSANTGISAIINDVGQIVEQQPWNKAAIIKYNIPLNNKITFYVKYGDYILLTGLLGTLLLALFFIYNFIKKRFI
jgi:apolipoprotein N-acyltransferase